MPQSTDEQQFFVLVYSASKRLLRSAVASISKLISRYIFMFAICLMTLNYLYESERVVKVNKIHENSTTLLKILTKLKKIKIFIKSPGEPESAEH